MCDRQRKQLQEQRPGSAAQGRSLMLLHGIREAMVEAGLLVK
jgi:hypothetical protein